MIPRRLAGKTWRIYPCHLFYSLGLALLFRFINQFCPASEIQCRHGGVGSHMHSGNWERRCCLLGSVEFWFGSFQNWQSEFLSTAVLVVLVFLLSRFARNRSRLPLLTAEPAGRERAWSNFRTRETWRHLCVDMQRVFAEDTPWHVEWMDRIKGGGGRGSGGCRRYLPPVLYRLKTVEEAPGAWRAYYEKWPMMTQQAPCLRYPAR